MESLIAIMGFATVGLLIILCIKSSYLDTNEEQEKEKEQNEEHQIFPNEPKSITKEMLMEKAESERALKEEKERKQSQQSAKEIYGQIYNIFVSYPDFEFSFDEIETLLYPYNHCYLRVGLTHLMKVELIKYNITTEKYSLQQMRRSSASVD